MVAAPIRAGQQQALADLLLTMNREPGLADPHNGLVPFAAFHTLHFARFVILDDQTLPDLAAYGTSFSDAPLYLAFLGDCDGPAGELLAAFAERAGSGLRQIFAHCQDFQLDADLLRWMLRHNRRPVTRYVNFLGRTVRQIRQEAGLHAALISYLRDTPAGETAQQTHARLVRRARDDGPSVSPRGPTPVLFQLRRLVGLGLAGLVLLMSVLLLLFTPLIVLIPIYLYRLRQLEASDPVIAPRPDDAYVRALAALEDRDVVNQFSAFGSLKPGWFRLGTLLVLLFGLNFAIALLYARGRLARIGTIHFARWVLLDNNRRLFFASNYDRSLETYADDFVNKVAYGINLVFSNGIGYPRTKFLLFEGAKNERVYRHYLRRHQLLTQVWYNAYPGLTTFDINRNASIRAGLERVGMSDPEIQKWLALI